MESKNAQELIKLLSDTLEDKNAIKNLKVALVDAGKYEFAAKIREIEKEKFPVLKEALEAEEKAHELEILFNLVGVKANAKTIWLMFKAYELYIEKQGKTDLKDAAEIKALADKYFD